MSQDSNIEDWRRRIDEIDLQLVQLFNERSQCAIEIGHVKHSQGLEVYSPDREAEVIANVIQANKGPLEREAIQRLFERVIDESRRVERLATRQETRSTQ